MVLRGLGQDPSIDSSPDTPAVSFGDTAQNVAVAVNSEALTLTNLVRQARGLPALAPSAATPKIGIALSPELQMIAVAAIGLLALYLLTRKR